MTNFVSDRALALFSIIRLVAPQHLRRLPGQPRHRRRPGLVSVADPRDAELGEFLVGRGPLAAPYIHRQRRALADRADTFTSAERPVGKECVSTCRSRWS